MKARRTTSDGTLGEIASSPPVRMLKSGAIVMSGLRPKASLSPPRIGLKAKVSTPASDSSSPCARACPPKSPSYAESQISCSLCWRM